MTGNFRITVLCNNQKPVRPSYKKRFTVGGKKFYLILHVSPLAGTLHHKGKTPDTGGKQQKYVRWRAGEKG
ncbi:hypothetical protein AGMMS50268_08270 [Spirochaetia bacterium]|nr:hypothetical protein AGMMS50268_08270 [Spirochaetia bacterium]